MKIIKIKKVYLLVVSIILVFSLSTGLFFSYKLGLVNPGFAGVVFRNVNSLQGRSSADLSIRDNYLDVSLNIDPKDQPQAEIFFKNLGVDMEGAKNISVGLDQQTLDKVSPLMPLNVAVVFDEKSLSFKNNQLSSLSSSLANTNYEISSGSAKMVFKSSSDREFSLLITDPKPLLEFATTSGKLHVSSLLNPVVPILAKMDRIEIQVDGKSVKGEVRLKD